MARSNDGTSGNFLGIDSCPVTALPFTAACWFYCPTGGTTDFTLMFLGDKDSGAGADDAFFALQAADNASDKVRARMINGSGTGVNCDTTTAYTANTWSHACMVHASSTDHRAFLNGGGKTTTANNRAFNAWDRYNIGRLGDVSPSNYMSGRVAHAAVWSVALSDDDVAELATGVDPRTVQRASLLCYSPILGTTDPEPDKVGSFPLTVGGTMAQAAGPTMRGVGGLAGGALQAGPMLLRGMT